MGRNPLALQVGCWEEMRTNSGRFLGGMAAQQLPLIVDKRLGSNSGIKKSYGLVAKTPVYLLDKDEVSSLLGIGNRQDQQRKAFCSPILKWSLFFLTLESLCLAKLYLEACRG